MAGYKDLTSICCAAALALGLAACGGSGGGGGSETSETPEEVEPTLDKAVAVAAAIEAAKATSDADGTFDDTSHMVAPAVTAMHDGMTVTVGVTEAGTPRGGTARSGDFVELADGPASVAGWTGARFERGTAAEHLAVYVDVGAPEAMAFTPENLNRLNEVTGLMGETIPEGGLVVEDPYLPIIRSTSLAAASMRGSVTYGATGMGEDEGLSFMGTFAGATGEYGCTGADCSVTLDDKGVPTGMMGDEWTFGPDEGAMVQIPDYDYLYFGWWLNETEDGTYQFQTFAGSTDIAAGSGIVTAAMSGSAIYEGTAAGVYVTKDIAGGQVTGAASGEFTARATLTAHFFGGQDAGEVTGTIDSFRNMAGESMDGWEVTLKAAGLTDDQASFAGETGGSVGPGSSGEGSWEGVFHGSDDHATNSRPDQATGRFDVHFPGAHVVGAFGASR